uniref:Uncharacterized protein n=1 Tax=Pipistrellus kuhlii TaxID=59472 RepID=A0A7J8A871_PIPKU|nr:hypothetical protein mPipKuh1_008947 [Pipistrellus kuhlii]
MNLRAWASSCLIKLYVSGVQFYNISSVYCIVYLRCKVYSPSVTIYPPFILFYQPHPSFPLLITVLLSVSLSGCFLFVFFCLIPLSISLCPSAPTPTPLTAVSLFSVSVSLFLFCLFVYFVCYIPHVSEIIGYLSSYDWPIDI